MIFISEEIVLEEGALDDNVRELIKKYEKIFQLEPGCLRYVTSVDISNPNVLRINEEWDSGDALSAHFKTDDMSEFQKALGGIKPKSMTSKVHEINSELKLEDFH